MAAWSVPIGAFFLLLLATRRSASAKEESKDGPRVLPPSAKAKATVKTSRVHHDFYPPAGMVQVAGDPSYIWDGRVWLRNGTPEFPAGEFLRGVPNGPLDGWYYDWHRDAWIEPGDSNHAVHHNFYPPAGMVTVKGEQSAWTWNGELWLHNGFPEFPTNKALTGIGPLSGWFYDWKQDAWIEPGAPLPHKDPAAAPELKATVANKAPASAGLTSKASKPWSEWDAFDDANKNMPSSGRVLAKGASSPSPTQAAPASTAPKQSNSDWPVFEKPTAPISAKKDNAAKAVVALAAKPDPHPQEVYNTAAVASDAGMHQTAQELVNVAARKADEKGIARPTEVAPVPTSTIRVISSTYPDQPIIKVPSSAPPLSHAQAAQKKPDNIDALSASLHNLQQAAQAPAPAPMQFHPEEIHQTPPDAMQFTPEEIHHSLPSPIDGVSDAEWSAMVALFEDDSNTISDTYLLGHFKMSAPRLADLGMMKDIRRAQYNGKTVWEGNFVEPLSMQIFINDPHLQYDTFAKEMKFLSDGIEQRGNDGKIPMTIHGVAPTRSGLLAVAKLAGLQGLDSFVKDKGDWDKFPATRDAFLKANGLF